MVSFLKCYQFHQIGTPPPSGQSRHLRLPLVLPYPTSSFQGFSASPKSHPDSFHPFLSYQRALRLPTFPISGLVRLGMEGIAWQTVTSSKCNFSFPTDWLYQTFCSVDSRSRAIYERQETNCLLLVGWEGSVWPIFTTVVRLLSPLGI